jgi:cell division protein FtsB
MSDTILTAEDINSLHRYASIDQRAEIVALCDSHEALRQQVATLTEERDALREELALSKAYAESIIQRATCQCHECTQARMPAHRQWNS